LTEIGKALAFPERAMNGPRLAGFGLLLAVSICSVGCRSFRPILLPSGEAREMEGYASLRLKRGEESARTKFAFVILLPDQARFDVFDALGRTISTFIIRGDEAYLVLFSERVYWRGGRDEVIEKFLGFPVRPAEIAGLLTGRWGREAAKDWTFDVDGRGRTISGTRGDLSFRVQEFRPGGDLPLVWSFRSLGTEGVIKLLEAAFDKPNPNVSLEVIRNFSSKTWTEIERFLR
jgi:hypothetical protein